MLLIIVSRGGEFCCWKIALSPSLLSLLCSPSLFHSFYLHACLGFWDQHRIKNERHLLLRGSYAWPWAADSGKKSSSQHHKVEYHYSTPEYPEFLHISYSFKLRCQDALKACRGRRLNPEDSQVAVRYCASPSPDPTWTARSPPQRV